MRLAILSDIHGNPIALDAVLADIQSQVCPLKTPILAIREGIAQDTTDARKEIREGQVRKEIQAISALSVWIDDAVAHIAKSRHSLDSW